MEKQEPKEANHDTVGTIIKRLTNVVWFLEELFPALARSTFEVMSDFSFQDNKQ